LGKTRNKWIRTCAQEKFARGAKDSSPTRRKGFGKLKDRAPESAPRRRASVSRSP
jgi:hypothetical protein